MIDTIISSSVLILLVFAIRLIFKGKINPVVQYGLWSLVALRLAAFSWLNLHPMESTLSVVNIFSSASDAIREASATEQVLAGNVQAGKLENAVFIMDNIKTGVMTSGDGISAAAAIDWQLVIMIVWGMGTVAFGLWFLLINLKFGKKLSTSRRFLITDNLPVYIADELDSPCLMRYRGEDAIYVTPKVAMDQKKLRYTIAHELCHFKHHDQIWSVVRIGLLSLYWFNPLVWAAAIMSKRDCELACDYEVIKKMDREDRLKYGKTLVDMVSQRESKNNVLRVATTMSGSDHGIKERIGMIASNRKMKAMTLIAVLLIAALSAGFTFTAAPNVPTVPNNAKETEVADFATKWADAVTGRDAKVIHELCKTMDLYLTIGGVAENGELWMGWSSPWPWNYDYVIDIVNPSTIQIYYYFRTSSPTVYTAKETVTVGKINNQLKALKDDWKHFDQIESREDFNEAYRFGFPDLSEFAEAYQNQADGNSGYYQGRKEILENPETAAAEELNLTGAKVSAIYIDPNAKKAVVKFLWDDGEVTVNLIQPMIPNEDGEKRQATIWIAAEKAENEGE